MKALVTILISLTWTGILITGLIMISTQDILERLRQAFQTWTKRKVQNMTYPAQDYDRDEAEQTIWADLERYALPRNGAGLRWTKRRRCGFDWCLGTSLVLDPYGHTKTGQNSPESGKVVSLSWYRSDKSLK